MSSSKKRMKTDRIESRDGTLSMSSSKKRMKTDRIESRGGTLTMSSSKKRMKTEEDTAMEPPKTTFLPQHVIDTYPDRLLKRMHLTREDLKLPLDELGVKSMELCGKYHKIAPSAMAEPRLDPDTPVPPGYVWSPYDCSSTSKYEIVPMSCHICDVMLDHWPSQCPKAKLRSNSRFTKHCTLNERGKQQSKSCKQSKRSKQ